MSDKARVAERILEVAAEEDWSLGRVRAERALPAGDGLEFYIEAPERVDLVHPDGGFLVPFLGFWWAPREVVQFVLSRLGLWAGRGEYVELTEEDGKLYWHGTMVAYLGEDDLAQRAWEQVKGRVVGRNAGVAQGGEG